MTHRYLAGGIGAFLWLGIALMSTVVHAAPITYTESATVSGSLGGSSFSNALFTISGTGDTTAVFTAVISVNPVVSPSFTIDGLGSGTFTTSMVVFDNPLVPAAGFGSSGVATLAATNAAFAGYSLSTAIGPITGSPLFTNPGAWATTLGELDITASGNVTFTAVLGTAPVPEPGTLLLLSSGLAGLATWRRKQTA